MQNSLSSLVDNLSEIHRKECELCNEIRIMSECRLIGLKIMNYVMSVKNVMMNHINQ